MTRGSVWRLARLKHIWALNVDYRHLHEDYEKRRPIALSMPANHDRFLSDVGLRDNGARVLRSVGQAGYLQYGPAIPLKAGFYRARWIASVDDAAGGSLGFVEIWADGGRLERQPVLLSGTVPAAHQRIAQLDFSLSSPVREIEYRFYVNADVRLSLERVELYSGLAVPSDLPKQ